MVGVSDMTRTTLAPWLSLFPLLLRMETTDLDYEHSLLDVEVRRTSTKN